MPFKPSSWVQKTPSPFGGLLTMGHVSPSDGALLVQEQVSFQGGPFLSEYIFARGAITTNQAFTWGTMPNENQELHSNFWSIANPSETRYFRLRTKFGRSFFVANCTIFAGYTYLQMSTDGISWADVMQIAQWPQILDDGRGGGQAQLTLGVIPLFLPGTGPGGADADWILLKCKVASNMGTPIDIFGWYRSDNFGFSWEFVRTETEPLMGGTVPNFITRGTQGRLLAGNANLFYSNNNGVTWTAVGGFLPPLVKGGALAHVGGTFSVYMSGGLTTTPSAGVLCDGTVAQATFGSFDGNSTNIFALQMGQVECIVVCRDTDVGGTGGRIWYSNDGGETFQDQGVDTRLPALQSSVVSGGFFPNGAPILIGVNGVVLVSGDRPSGNFKQRTFCPTQWAGLQKAGPPNLCGHPILQNRC